MQEQTSIRISSSLLNTLKKFKEEGDSYEDVIWDFIEPHLDLSKQTKKDRQERKLLLNIFLKYIELRIQNSVVALIDYLNKEIFSFL